jgi:hypothetical protein
LFLDEQSNHTLTHPHPNFGTQNQKFCGSKNPMVLGKVLGNLSWATKAVKYGQAHLRDLRVLYITESRRLKGNLLQLTSLSPGAIKDL